LLQEILSQCGTLQNRVGILDLRGAQLPDPVTFVQDQIEPFRAAVGQQYLKYGVAYYPFLKTTIHAESEITCDMLGGAMALAGVLPEASQEPVKGLLASLQKTPVPNPAIRSQWEIALRQSSPTYTTLCQQVCDRINILPPSGAMAGVYARVDAERGVWVAPANVSLTEVVGTTLALTDDMQSGLNTDPLSGKSVNAIRVFPSLGTLVWGARTLDGNSQDWRYISVVRTVIMIEQSVKFAMQAYVFQPNVANTWNLVRATLTSFLTQLWSQGTLAGSTPDAAFSVEVGLGATMTSQDILNGLMIVSLKVALTHPAEFIVLTFAQQMQTS
ncbi:MAG: phage tail sheath family protein, partial [Verrucomicrobiales bacterium]|nr:phage tail sheath family protein [Verrucomicrobiales bacterium]